MIKLRKYNKNKYFFKKDINGFSATRYRFSIAKLFLFGQNRQNIWSDGK